MDRTAFLRRVRGELRGTRAPERPPAWPATPASGSARGPAAVLAFLEALAGVGGVGRAVARQDLAAAVTAAAAALPEGAGRTAVVAPDTDAWREAIDAGLAAAGVEPVRPAPDGWREAAAAAGMGITSAALGVASTGSVLIVPGPNTPRVAGLLPEAHLVLLPADQLVPGLEEAMPVLASLADRSSAPVLVTGPSRTSDIEMVTVFGAHGPRRLEVLLIG